MAVAHLEGAFHPRDIEEAPARSKFRRDPWPACRRAAAGSQNRSIAVQHIGLFGLYRDLPRDDAGSRRARSDVSKLSLSRLQRLIQHRSEVLSVQAARRERTVGVLARSGSFQP